MTVTAVYAGSFDFVTHGHLGVIEGALGRAGVDQIVVSVVTSQRKRHFLERRVAAKLFEWALPEKWRAHVSVMAASSREAIGRSGATLRVKGVRDPRDVRYEAENIVEAINSAGARNQKPLDVLWVVDKQIPNEELVMSSRLKQALFAASPARDHLLRLVPPTIADLLLEVRGAISHSPQAKPEAFQAAFNRELEKRLDAYLATRPEPRTAETAAAPRTHAEIAPRIVGQIQKKGGHLYAISRSIIRRVFGAYDADDTRTVTLGLPGSPLSVDIRADRMSDSIAAVAAGYSDWAIVSTHALALWRETHAQSIAREGKDPFDTVAHLGPAGCQWMMLVAAESERKWQDLLKDPAARPIIVTSNKRELLDFLRRRGLATVAKENGVEIYEQDGGTERFGRYLVEREGRPVLIFDSVATGKTAFKHGFRPVLERNPPEEESHDVILIRPAPHKRRATAGVDIFINEVQKRRPAIGRDLVRSYMEKIKAFRDNPDVPVELRGAARIFARRRLAQLRAHRRAKRHEL